MKNNENQLNNLFEKARNQEPKTSFNETKGQFLNDLKAGKTSSFNQEIANSFTFKNWIIMLSTVSVIIVSAVLFLNSNKPITIAKPSKTVIKSEQNQNLTKLPIIINDELIIIESITIENNEIRAITTTFDNREGDTIKVRKKVEKDTIIHLIKSKITLLKPRFDTVFRFPKLTLQEIEANNKQKAKMLKQIGKMDKKKYAYIPSGTFNHKGKNVSVQAFYMGKTEVTVLEYRTFLFDLLINGQKEKFLIAKPDQKQWNYIMGHKQTTMQPMVDLYFSHPAYNEYPVNNISREGAEMYCNWLTTEYSKSKKGKKQPVINDFRIPTDEEWMLAAYGGNTNQPDFPWGTSSIKNGKDCYLANYKPIVDPLGKLVDNAKFTQFNTEEGGGKELFISKVTLLKILLCIIISLLTELFILLKSIHIYPMITVCIA